ncbi:MAG: translation initiation factor IF-3, partial [Eubacterium sp.]
MFFISKDAPQLNGEIRDKELRVIADDGEQLGIMSAKEAQKLADSKGKD